MTHRKPEQTVDLVLQALAHTQRRSILLSVWGGLRGTSLPESVFMLDAIPFS
jgi:hypothetical protein